jgi:hypothetical protein
MNNNKYKARFAALKQQEGIVPSNVPPAAGGGRAIAPTYRQHLTLARMGCLPSSIPTTFRSQAEISALYKSAGATADAHKETHGSKPIHGGSDLPRSPTANTSIHCIDPSTHVYHSIGMMPSPLVHAGYLKAIMAAFVDHNIIDAVPDTHKEAVEIWVKHR